MWTYFTFMSAWLLGNYMVPAIPYWSPAWTYGTTNVSDNGHCDPLAVSHAALCLDVHY